MKNPKVGERVACYQSADRDTGIVKSTDVNGRVMVEADALDSSGNIRRLFVFRQQIRRLVPRKRVERWTMEEIQQAWNSVQWNSVHSSAYGYAQWTNGSGSTPMKNELNKIAEARKGKKE